MDGSDGFPETVDAAVRLLITMVPKAEQARIAAMARDELVVLHFGLGLWIRNNLELWQGNRALLEACGVQSPDDASTFLIEAFWRERRALEPKLH